MHRIFIYNSLKKNFRNHRFLKNHSAHFIDEGVTSLFKYDMMAQGNFPAVIPGSLRIRGEVYRITPTCLDALDSLENEGKILKRNKISITLQAKRNKNKEVDAWIYILIDNFYSNSLVFERHLSSNIDEKDGILTWVYPKGVSN